MKKSFVKSKFFIICVIVAAAMVIIPAALAAFGQVDLLRSGLATAAKPFLWCGTKVADAYSGFVSVFTDYNSLLEENKALREEIESMKDQQADVGVLENENKWLRDFLELKNKNPQLELADAKVVSHEVGSAATVLTLNKGAVHGIKNNMPVITADGVVGYVFETGLDWCKVTTIIEPKSNVAVYTDRTAVIGTVEGSVEHRAEGTCIITYAPDADIKVGDRVYTSGTGSIYPDGLAVGKIISVTADETTRQLIAVVQPEVDFNNLTALGSVMIVRGYAGHTDGSAGE